MQQIQAPVNPSRIVISEGRQEIDEDFISGLTWAAVLQFAGIHDCIIYRDGDTLRVVIVSPAPITHWGTA